MAGPSTKTTPGGPASSAGSAGTKPSSRASSRKPGKPKREACLVPGCLSDLAQKSLYCSAHKLSWEALQRQAKQIDKSKGTAEQMEYLKSVQLTEEGSDIILKFDALSGERAAGARRPRFNLLEFKKRYARMTYCDDFERQRYMTEKRYVRWAMEEEDPGECTWVFEGESES